MAKKRGKQNKSSWEIEINLRAWKDPEFKKRLLKNPQKTLKEIGFSTGSDLKKLQILEETDDTQYIILLKPPAQYKALSDTELRGIAAADAAGGSKAPSLCGAVCITRPSGCRRP